MELVRIKKPESTTEICCIDNLTSVPLCGRLEVEVVTIVFLAMSFKAPLKKRRNTSLSLHGSPSRFFRLAVAFIVEIGNWYVTDGACFFIIAVGVSFR